MPIQCPSCKSSRIHRSKTRGFFESFVARFAVRPFRCERCDSRFFRRLPKAQSKTGPLAPAT